MSVVKIFGPTVTSRNLAPSGYWASGWKRGSSSLPRSRTVNRSRSLRSWSEVVAAAADEPGQGLLERLMVDDEPVAQELEHLGELAGIGQVRDSLRTRRPP